MEPALTIALCWLLFGGTHIGLATRRIRGALVERFGERGFTLVFSAVAALTFSLLVMTYAAVRSDGAPGPALAEIAGGRTLLMASAFIGIVLLLAPIVVAPSPTTSGGPEAREPRGLERITRHPFFVGVTLFAVAHALLARHLVGTVFFGALALQAIVGARHQDAKLLARRGAPFGEYLAATSTVPFAAILSGRQRLVWREIRWWGLAIGVAAAWGLRSAHASIFDHGGLWIIGTTVGGAGILLVVDLLRRRSEPLPTAPTSGATG